MKKLTLLIATMVLIVSCNNEKSNSENQEQS